MMRDPTTTPFRSISCPFALSGNIIWARPVTTRGYTSPNRTVVASVINTAVSRFLFISGPLREPDPRDQHVDQLDPDERHHDSAESVDEQVVAQQSRGSQRAIPDPAQRQRDQGNYDQRVEDHCGEHGGLGGPQ